MIRRWFVKDTDNPPGQVVNPVGRPADTLQNNIEEWKRWEKERNELTKTAPVLDERSQETTSRSKKSSP
jgi:hypothetical protein